MLKRRILQVFIAATAVVAGLFGAAGTANASPTAFHASSVHANGAGALAVAFQGGLIWGNRSVTLTTPRLWVGLGECGWIEIWGKQGDKVIDVQSFGNNTPYCPAGDSQWYRFSDILLDGSDVPGGITEVKIYVVDEYHNGLGRTICLRSSSVCTEDNAVPPGSE